MLVNKWARRPSRSTEKVREASPSWEARQLIAFPPEVKTTCNRGPSWTPFVPKHVPGQVFKKGRHVPCSIHCIQYSSEALATEAENWSPHPVSRGADHTSPWAQIRLRLQKWEPLPSCPLLGPKPSSVCLGSLSSPNSSARLQPARWRTRL